MTPSKEVSGVSKGDANEPPASKRPRPARDAKARANENFHVMPVQIENQQTKHPVSSQMNSHNMHKESCTTSRKYGPDSGHENEVFDANLYSRQIYALGESAMIHLRKSAVLISGIGGVGVEIAKNLILGGVRHVTIHDTKETTWYDLSSQYYLGQNDIGQNRAQCCLSHLAELNDTVQVSASLVPLTEDMIGHFDLVILTDANLKQQDVVNTWTREKGCYFLVADARGLFSYVAVDAGERFQIDDKNGEQCHEFLIDYIDKESGDITTFDNVPHNLEDGDYVTFVEVKGMTELNNCEPLKVTVKKPDVFTVGHALKEFSDHTGGGRGRQVKVPVMVDHVDLATGREDPELIIWDFGKLEYGICLHYLWQALYAFEEKHKRSPLPRNENDLSLFYEELIDAEEVEYPEYLVRNFCFQAKGNLVNTCSVVGGIASQEAMKLITHHMTPLKQFMYIDHLEALPAPGTGYDANDLTEEDCGPRDTRYDGQVAVFGWNYQEELLRQRWFIVGAGAIGCELLKNFAMMGVACDPSRLGLMNVTDMDQIEVSNLNRQFLFRRHDVGKKKSDCASRAARCFNPDLNIIPLSERVCPETEHIFDDSFFERLNGVANALDNVDARRYVDRRCVYYRLPLLESGTQGTKGNTQVIYPYLTESYGSSADPPETEIPMCTLKNFPHQIHHTIQWARDRFEGLFSNPAELANSFLSDQRGFHDRLKTVAIGQKIEMLSEVIKTLIDDRPNNAEDCIKWARLLFDDYYHNTIAQLLFTFPPEQITSQGVKFWSGAKRCPHVLNFDSSKEEHFNFVMSASILHAEKYGIEPILDKSTILAVLKSVDVPTFKPSAGVKIAVTEAEAKDSSEDIAEDAEQMLDDLLIRLAKMPTSNFQALNPIDFEKDDDTNHHIEFITAASNLRAENYDLEPADAMKTKQIAGRIIPALATTTATVAGLISIELFKMIDKDGKLPTVPISRFKNTFINLALPFFGMSEPVGAPEKTYNDVKFTLWDRLEVSGPMTLRAFIKWIEDKSKMKISMLSSGVSLIYAYFMPAPKLEARMNMGLKEVVEDVTKKPVPSHTRGLVFEATMDGEFDSIEIPYIRYCLPDM
uniref:E1 ubiquitin-activating enzyme n=1 Tax=Steinernema glaseri TaxID=37863 RepID=A0A1I7YYQ7_9BILA